jgi:CDP-paratose 2-epimerase
MKRNTIIVTGSAGLIGSETVKHFAAEGRHIVGIDNDMRSRFFGAEASTRSTRDQLVETIGDYEHHDIDIRDAGAVRDVFQKHARNIAACRAHGGAAVTRLGGARSADGFHRERERHAEPAGSRARVLPRSAVRFHLDEQSLRRHAESAAVDGAAARWEIEPGHEYEPGISETMSIDHTKHSLFGASKVAADILVQEYGRYLGMPTACFRGGCLTGPAHAGTELHGFLSYLMKCTVTGRPYRVFGYGGKQVRDNIHSFDLVEAFAAFIEAPRVAEVYNLGGSRHSNCSMLEAIKLCEEISGRQLTWTYEENNRIGDHIWWISDVRRFQEHYPSWKFRYGLREILEEIHEAVIGSGVAA